MSRIDKIKQQWSIERLSLIGGMTPFAARSAIDAAIQADPTANKKYLSWILDSWLRHGVVTDEGGPISQDFIQANSNTLRLFDASKQSLEPEDRSINRYSSIEELQNVLKPTQSRKYTRRMFSQKMAFEIYRTTMPSGMKISIPTTNEAAILLGKGTKWCTSSDMGHIYLRESALICFELPTGEKYQMSVIPDKKVTEQKTSLEFADAMDIPVLSSNNNIAPIAPYISEICSILSTISNGKSKPEEIETFLYERKDSKHHNASPPLIDSDKLSEIFEGSSLSELEELILKAVSNNICGWTDAHIRSLFSKLYDDLSDSNPSLDNTTLYYRTIANMEALTRSLGIPENQSMRELNTLKQEHGFVCDFKSLMGKQYSEMDIKDKEFVQFFISNMYFPRQAEISSDPTLKKLQMAILMNGNNTPSEFQIPFMEFDSDDNILHETCQAIAYLEGDSAHVFLKKALISSLVPVMTSEIAEMITLDRDEVVETALDLRNKVIQEALDNEFLQIFDISTSYSLFENLDGSDANKVKETIDKILDTYSPSVSIKLTPGNKPFP